MKKAIRDEFRVIRDSVDTLLAHCMGFHPTFAFQVTWP